MEESIANLMKMDKDIETFIEKYANSFIKWEVVQFFYDHQQDWFKLQELIAALNRPQKPLKKELLELKAGGFLEENKTAKGQSFRLCQVDSSDWQILKSTLERFISLCHDREGRLRIVYKLLKNGKPIQGQS